MIMIEKAGLAVIEYWFFTGLDYPLYPGHDMIDSLISFVSYFLLRCLVSLWLLAPCIVVSGGDIYSR